MPAARRMRIGIVPYFPLASGMLTGKYKRGEEFPEGSRFASMSYFASVASDENFDRIDALAKFAEARGHTLLELAVAWLAAQDGVGSVICGATTRRAGARQRGRRRLAAHGGRPRHPSLTRRADRRCDPIVVVSYDPAWPGLFAEQRRPTPDRMRRVDRVFITGGAGSGKTTLGRTLATRWELPHYQMDLGETADVCVDTRWVVEGGMLWDVDRFLDAADLVVWLDLKPSVTIPRIVTRHVKLTLQGTNRHPGLRRLVRFVRWQPTYYRAPARRPTGPLDFSQSRAGTEEVLQPYRERVVQLETPRQVRHWLGRRDATA